MAGLAAKRAHQISIKYTGQETLTWPSFSRVRASGVSFWRKQPVGIDKL